MTAGVPRRIIVCADDFGMSEGVNRAILDLMSRRRINAASVMVVGPAFKRETAERLQAAAKDHGQIGLHVTLTAPFRPLTMHVRPLQGDAFLPLPKMFRASLLRRLDVEIMRAEILAQLTAFADLFGCLPDYLDGHQHVQIFPRIRDAVLDVIKASAPQAWVRQCGRMPDARRALNNRKSLILDILSAGFRARARQAGVRVNPAFAGAYDFAHTADFAGLFEGFIDGLPDGGLVMCHPGFVDETLLSLDPVTTQRERETEFLNSERYLAILAKQNMALA